MIVYEVLVEPALHVDKEHRYFSSRRKAVAFVARKTGRRHLKKLWCPDFDMSRNAVCDLLNRKIEWTELTHEITD